MTKAQAKKRAVEAMVKVQKLYMDDFITTKQFIDANTALEKIVKHLQR